MPNGPLNVLAAIWLTMGSLANTIPQLEELAKSLNGLESGIAKRETQDQMAMLPLKTKEIVQCTVQCESPLARAWSAHCLGHLPGPQSQAALLSALKDDSPKVRREALEGLARIGDRTNIQALMKAAARESDPALQALAKQASQQLVARSRSRNPAEDWSRLQAPNAMERKAALERAGKSENWGLLPQVVEAASDHHPAVREAAILALGKLGDDRALPVLHNLILKESGKSQYAAIGAIAQLSNTQSLPFLNPLVHSEDKDTRRYTARALGWIASPKKIEALSILARDSQDTVRTEVLLALGRSDAKITGPLLVQLLTDDLVFLRSESARLLGSTPLALAAEPLTEALNDRDPLVRINAANSLSILGAVSAIQALKSRIRKAETPEEAAYYRKALGQLGVTAPD